jgi:hypothetical protein
VFVSAMSFLCFWEEEKNWCSCDRNCTWKGAARRAAVVKFRGNVARWPWENPPHKRTTTATGRHPTTDRRPGRAAPAFPGASSPGAIIATQAIIGSNGANVTLYSQGQRSELLTLSSESDSKIWVTDAAGGPLKFIQTRPILLRTDGRISVTTRLGEQIEGTYLASSDLGIVLRPDGRRELIDPAVIIPPRSLSSLTIGNYTSRFTVRFNNPGEAFVYYRTSSLTARARTLVNITITPRDVAPQLYAGTTLEIANNSPKAHRIQEAVIVTHAIAREPRPMSEALTMAPRAKMAAEERGPESASSEAPVFTATIPDLQLDPFSSTSLPLDPWRFEAVLVVVASINYTDWMEGQLHVGEPRVAALITSQDERLFPGGETSVISKGGLNAAEIFDTSTSELATGEVMVLPLMPANRTKLRIDDVRIAQQEPGFRTINFTVSVAGQMPALLLFGVPYEVLNYGENRQIRTNENEVYYKFAGASRVVFQIRVPHQS